METIELGDIEVRPEENCLRVHGQDVHLEPKVMAVLLVLLEQPERVVSRQELMDRVWADRVVGEEVLTRCISELRTALGDQARDPRYIQTVPKKGYRLLMTPSPVSRSPGRHRLMALAAAAVLTVAVIVVAGVLDRGAPLTRIAVLPFTTDAAQDHLGSGVAEELINTLVGVPDLRVTSRTSAFAERAETDPKLIGEALDVDALVTGSLRRTDTGFRVSVQLVDVSSGDHLWAQAFEGPESGLYGIQDQIVAGVTDALGVTPDTPLKVARATLSIDALDLYLLGRHHWHERTPEGLERAVGYFRQAIEADPTMAQAYSGLADAYLLQTDYDNRESESALALAGPLVDRALELEPESADAHASHGILLQGRGEFEAAEAALARAVALNPNHSMAHMWRGNAELALGRLAPAFAHYERAYALDPQHPAVTHNYVNTLIELGRYPEAREILTRRLAGEKSMLRMSAQLALEAGDWDEATRLADAMVDDPVGAALLRWRLDVQRQNLSGAESHLAAAIAGGPEDERVYLAALEHRTLAQGMMQFEGLLSRFEERVEVSEKTRLKARAWAAIHQVKRGALEAATTELAALLTEFREAYPPLRLKLLSHLLIALQGSGQLEAYERWRTDAIAALTGFVESGWASFEFQVERGYLLAAAGDPVGAVESFRAADLVGDISTLRLSGDPRTGDAVDLLNDFI